MTEAKSKRERWKNHERLVAATLGGIRNVHGRGDHGMTCTDVVAPLHGFMPADTADILETAYGVSHVFVECKYAFGRNTPLFQIMMMTRKNVGMTAKDPKVPITIWGGKYLLFYLRHFSVVFQDIVLQNTPSLMHAIKMFGIRHLHTKIPKYIDDWQAQVQGDVQKRNVNKIKNAVPFVCAGDSGREKVAIYDLDWVLPLRKATRYEDPGF